MTKEGVSKSPSLIERIQYHVDNPLMKDGGIIPLAAEAVGRRYRNIESIFDEMSGTPPDVIDDQGNKLTNTAWALGVIATIDRDTLTDENKELLDGLLRDQILLGAMSAKGGDDLGGKTKILASGMEVLRDAGILPTDIERNYASIQQMLMSGSGKKRDDEANGDPYAGLRDNQSVAQKNGEDDFNLHEAFIQQMQNLDPENVPNLETGKLGGMSGISYAMEGLNSIYRDITSMEPVKYIQRSAMNILGNPIGTSQIEQIRVNGMYAFPNIMNKSDLDWNSLIEGASMFTHKTYERWVGAIGKVADLFQKLGNPETRHAEAVMNAKSNDLIIKRTKEGKLEDLGEMTVARAYDMIENIFVEEYFVNDHQSRERTKNDIAKSMLSEMGLDEESEFFAANWSTITGRNITSYEDLLTASKWSINGAESLMYTFLRYAYLNPEISGRWVYALRGPMRPDRYRQMYAILGFWERFFYDGKYRDFESENANKLVNLLNGSVKLSSEESLPNNVGFKEKQRYIKKRKEYVEYILFDEPLPAVCKPAMTMMMYGEGKFDSPITNKTYDFNNFDQQIQFLQDHRRDYYKSKPWLTTNIQMKRKLAGLMENPRTRNDLVRFFADVDFSDEIDRMIKVTSNLSNSDKPNPNNMKGVDGLVWVINHMSKSQYNFSKLDQHDLTKQWRYVETEEAAISATGQIFNAITAFISNKAARDSFSNDRYLTLKGAVGDIIKSYMGLQMSPGYLDGNGLTSLLEDVLDGVISNIVEPKKSFPWLPAIHINEENWQHFDFFDFNNMDTNKLTLLNDILINAIIHKKHISNRQEIKNFDSNYKKWYQKYEKQIIDLSPRDKIEYIQKKYKIQFLLEKPNSQQRTQFEKHGALFRKDGKGLVIGMGGNVVYPIAKGQFNESPFMTQFGSSAITKLMLKEVVSAIADSRGITGAKRIALVNKIQKSDLRNSPKYPWREQLSLEGIGGSGQ